MILIVSEVVGNFEMTTEQIAVYEVADFGTQQGISASIFTAAGELIGASGPSTPVIVPGGSAPGQTLTWDPGAATKMSWQFPVVEVEDPTNNLLNGGFEFAQRLNPVALTTVPDNTHGPDQWKCVRETADLQYIRVDGSAEAGLSSNYYGQFKKITNAGKFLMAQPLEFDITIPLRGRTMSFQLKMKASASKTIYIALVELNSSGTANTIPALVSAYNADGTHPTLGANLAVIGSPVACDVTTTWTNFVVTATIPSNSNNLLMALWTDADFAANDTLSLAEAGLYFGTTPRAWTPFPYNEMLTKLQKFFEKSFGVDRQPATAVGLNAYEMQFMAGKAGAALQYCPTIRYLARKFLSTPTVTIYNPSAANAQVRDATAPADCTATTVVSVSGHHFFLSCTGAAGTLVGNKLAFNWTSEAAL